MKTKTFIKLMTVVMACGLMACCQKTNPQEVKCWDSDWLVGTWEGTTPSSITPFASTKIKIVIRKARLASESTTPGGAQNVWAYDGTFTWDVDNDAWSQDFFSNNYPLPDYNIIIWSCMTMTQANTTVNNISLRIADTIQTNTMHGIDLDWGPENNTSGNAPTQLDFYGDVTIDIGEETYRADYPPQAGSMIRLKKK